MSVVLALLLVTSSASASIDQSRRTAIVNAAERVSPAVVSVSVLATTVVASRPFFEDPFFGEFWGHFFPTPYIRRQVRALGSGFIVDSSGIVITNAHVVSGAEVIKVTLPDGRTFDADLLGEADKLDIAVLKIPGKHLPVAPIGDSDRLLIGEWAIAIGNPFGFLMEDLEPTVTVGVISALHRTFKGRSERLYRDMIQTDAAINPGNSGGPLVNALGEVIGMNTFIITKSGGSEGMGFAIPINTVMKIAREIVEYGHVREGYLGITVQDLTDALREGLGFSGTGGVLINSVDPQGPLAGKVKEGDILLRINRRRILNSGDFEDFTYALVPGERFTFTLWRQGKTFTVRARSVEFRIASETLDYGLTVAQITPALVQKYGLQTAQGVVVVSVDPQSPFARIGLQPGDVILSLNRHDIRTVEDLRRALKSLRRGYLEVVLDRQGQRLWYRGTF